MCLERRLTRLERELFEDGAGGCPACGQSREPRVLFILPCKHGSEDACTGRTHCPQCGRRLAVRIVPREELEEVRLAHPRKEPEPEPE
jgi:hypothetical protein